jgi:hypothetical protein
VTDLGPTRSISSDSGYAGRERTFPRKQMSENEGECVSCEPNFGPWVWSAYRAYNELLREKVKQRFDAQEGPWMDKVADLLVQVVNARWEGGRKKEKELEELYGRLEKLLAE